jgi:hypothetical protein
MGTECITAPDLFFLPFLLPSFFFHPTGTRERSEESDPERERERERAS